MVAAAILAGGQGRRLGGIIKSLLVVDGQTVIDRQLAILRPLFQTIVIVAPDGGPFAARGIDLPVIADRQGPGLGPLAGLDAALAWLTPRCQSLVCVAGDMPFLAPRVLEHLRDAAPADAPAVVPRLTAGSAGPLVQPLCARYHRSVGTLAAAELAAGTRAMHIFVQRITATSKAPVSWIDEPLLRQLDPRLATFANINTPADLAINAPHPTSAKPEAGTR